MVDNESQNGESGKSHIEEILMERERLEQVLKDKFRQEVSILFSDICDYTQYVDRRGDISGRTLLIKHNQIVLPIIEEHKGKIIEIVGDAVMASFVEPLNAVRAAVSIQEALVQYNARAVEADSIHVSISMNVGEVLVDEHAAFQSLTGDVANVASRIQREAENDQILISKALYKKVCGSEDILCRFHGSVQVKGKAEALDIYRVMWRDEEIFLADIPKVRVFKEPDRRAEKKVPMVLQVEANLEGDLLRISAHEGEKGEAITIRNYEDIQVSMGLIDERCQVLVDTLNKANQRGRITREALLKLREIGQVFHDELFSITIKEKLKNTKAEYLCFNLDEKLVHIPWELLNDGRYFLCQRFAMGRIVKTRQSLFGNRSRDLARPLNMLILADPTKDLNGAYAEGIQIRDFLDQYIDYFNVALRSESIDTDSIRQKMRNFDIVHFAGHMDYKPRTPDQSGWRLSDGILKTDDIIKMAGTSAMPALIFSNSCQSARVEELALARHFQNKIFGIANAFLLAGVKHFVGTFWEIMDEPSSRFALEFYKYLVSGTSVGEAIRQTRKTLIKEYGEETIVWASYLLYGDPTSDYMDQIRLKEYKEELRADQISEPATATRTREEIIDFAEKEKKKPLRKWGAIAACILLMGAVLLWGYPGLLRKGPGVYEKAAWAHFSAGDYSKASETCRLLEEKYPDRALSHVILGNIHFTNGDKENASRHYQNAMALEKGSKFEKAQAMIGLGRIASVEDKPERALKYYQQAATLAPDNARAYISQAVILDKDKKYDDALTLFEKAKQLSPGEKSIDAIIAKTRRKVQYLQSREKQERIDKLVRELLESTEKAPLQPSSDGWTSLPLTVWVMDLKSTGYSLYEGEDTIVHSRITENLLVKSRARVVERELLDKLLEELRLGTGKLADSQTALSLGKILTARVILPGQIIHQGPQTQVNFRIIETETGAVKAVVNEIFETPVSSSDLAEKLSDALIFKFENLYPLRGKIKHIQDNQVVLNIGTQQGVQVGNKFKVVDTDIELKIRSVQPTASTAVVETGSTALMPGQQVESF